MKMKEDFDKYKFPRGKKTVQMSIRITPELHSEIERECNYLGVTKTAWLLMTADHAIRKVKKERAEQNSPNKIDLGVSEPEI